MITARRTCQTKKCLGESEKTYDRCEKEKYHFFNRCRSKDRVLVGSCMNKKQVKVSTGDILGHYVSVRVNQKQCVEDCKNVPGAVGCQFKRKNCERSDDCMGECFVIFEDIVTSDRMPDVVCYVFKHKTKGKPGMF